MKLEAARIAVPWFFSVKVWTKIHRTLQGLPSFLFQVLASMFAYFHYLAFQIPPAEFPPLLSCQLPHCFACAPFSSWYRFHLASPWATPPWFLPGGWSFFQSTSPVVGRPSGWSDTDPVSGTVASILHVFCHLMLTKAPWAWSYPFWGWKMNLRALSHLLARRATAHITQQQRGILGARVCPIRMLCSMSLSSLSPLCLFKCCVLCLLFLSFNSSVFSKETSLGSVPGAPLCSSLRLRTWTLRLICVCFLSE